MLVSREYTVHHEHDSYSHTALWVTIESKLGRVSSIFESLARPKMNILLASSRIVSKCLKVSHFLYETAFIVGKARSSKSALSRAIFFFFSLSVGATELLILPHVNPRRCVSSSLFGHPSMPGLLVLHWRWHLLLVEQS